MQDELTLLRAQFEQLSLAKDIADEQAKNREQDLNQKLQNTEFELLTTRQQLSDQQTENQELNQKLTEE